MVKRRQEEQATETQDVSEWYERCIERLLRQSGLDVQREPCINGKTPDLIVSQPNGPSVIIECFVKLKDLECQRELLEGKVHVCGGDVRELHSTLYSRVENKATKYRNLLDGRPYVIAIYNKGCDDFTDTLLRLAFSAHVPRLSLDPDGNVRGTGHVDVWSTSEKSASLFNLHPHLSGLIYSRRGSEHYFLPNPFTDMPVSPNLFPFPDVPDSHIITG